MVTASSIAVSASSRRPRSPSRTARLFSDPARRLLASGCPSTVHRGRPVVSDLLAGEGGGKGGELHAVLGHLVGERRGEVGLGCEMQREAGQFGVVGGDRQVDDSGQCRGE